MGERGGGGEREREGVVTTLFGSLLHPVALFASLTDPISLFYCRNIFSTRGRN